MSQYEVVVGNVGTIYSGSSKKEATKRYNSAVKSSKLNSGRDAGESVTLFCDSDICKEHVGPQSYMEEAETWDVHSLDVWGNAKNGYEVNQAYRTGRTVRLPESASKALICELLIYQDELVGKCKDFIIDNDSEQNIYVKDRKGKPLLKLEKQGGY